MLRLQTRRREVLQITRTWLYGSGAGVPRGQEAGGARTSTVCSGVSRRDDGIRGDGVRFGRRRNRHQLLHTGKRDGDLHRRLQAVQRGVGRPLHHSADQLAERGRRSAPATGPAADRQRQDPRLDGARRRVDRRVRRGGLGVAAFRRPVRPGRGRRHQQHIARAAGDGQVAGQALCRPDHNQYPTALVPSGFDGEAADHVGRHGGGGDTPARRGQAELDRSAGQAVRGSGGVVQHIAGKCWRSSAFRRR